MRISDWSSDVCSSDLSEASRLERLRRLASLRADADAARARAEGIMNDVYPKAVKTLAQVREGYARGGFLFADVQDAADNIIQMQAQWAEAMTTRSEEHTSELQSLMRISYAVFCLKKKTTLTTN